MKKILSLMLALCMIVSLCTSLAIVPVSAEYTELDPTGFTVEADDANGSVLAKWISSAQLNDDLIRSIYRDGSVPGHIGLFLEELPLTIFDHSEVLWFGAGWNDWADAYHWGGELPVNEWPLNFYVDLGGAKTISGVTANVWPANENAAGPGYAIKKFRVYVKNTLAGETEWSLAGEATDTSNGTENLALTFEEPKAATDMRIELVDAYTKLTEAQVYRLNNETHPVTTDTPRTIAFKGFDVYGSEEVSFSYATLAYGETGEKVFYKSNPEDISYEFELIGNPAFAGVTLDGEAVDAANYTFEDNILTFDAEYLADFEADSENIFAVNFGEDLSVDVTVMIIEEIPTGVWIAEGEDAFKTFKKSEPSDIEFAFELLGNVAFAGVTLDGEEVDAEHYTFNENALTFDKEYLSVFVGGNTKEYIVDFGNDYTVAVAINIDSTPALIQNYKMSTEGFTAVGSDRNGRPVQSQFNQGTTGYTWDLLKSIYHDGPDEDDMGTYVEEIDVNTIFDNTYLTWFGAGWVPGLEDVAPLSKWPLDIDINLGGVKTVSGIAVLPSTAERGHDLPELAIKEYKVFVKNTEAGDVEWRELGTALDNSEGKGDLIFDFQRNIDVTDIRIQLLDSYSHIPAHMASLMSTEIYTVTTDEPLYTAFRGVEIYSALNQPATLAGGEDAVKIFQKRKAKDLEYNFAMRREDASLRKIVFDGEIVDPSNYEFEDGVLTFKKEYLLGFEDGSSNVFVVDFGDGYTINITVEILSVEDGYDMIYNIASIDDYTGDEALKFDVPEGKILFKLMAGDVQLNATQEGNTITVPRVDFRNAVDLFKIWADDGGTLVLTIVYLDEEVEEYKVKLNNIYFEMNNTTIVETGGYSSDEIIPQRKNWSVAVSSTAKPYVESIFSSALSNQTYHSHFSFVAGSDNAFSDAYKGNQHYMDIDLGEETAFSGIRFYTQETVNGNRWNNLGAWNKVSIYGRNSQDEAWAPLLEEFELNMSTDLNVPRNKAIMLSATTKCRYVRIHVQDSQFSIVRALRFLKPKSAFKSAEIINNPIGMDIELEEDAIARFNLNGAGIITEVTLADDTEIPEGYITIDKDVVKISYLYFVNNGYTEEGTEIDMKAKFAFGDEVLFKVKVGEAEGYRVFYAPDAEGLNGTVSAIAYNDISGEKVKSSGDKVRATDELTFVATPSAGYEVAAWDIYVVDDSGEIKISDTEPQLQVVHKGTASEEVKIVDRFDNMKVVATFEEIEGAGVENVSLEYNLENVTAESSPSTAIIGNDLTLGFTSDIDNDYYMPEDIVIKMDGNILKKDIDYTYERSGLVISAEDPDAFESATLVIYNIKGSKLTIEVKGADLESYIVSYDDDKGATGTLPSSINVGKGRTFVVADAGLQLSGYKFAGWVCNEQTYNVGDVVTMGDSDMVMLAKWTVDNSDPDGGYIGGNTDKNTGKDDKNFGGGMIVGGTEAIYTVVIAGVEGKTLQVVSGAIIEAPAAKEGYNFAGYYLDAALTIPYKNDGAKGSVTLYPSWVKRTREDLKDIQNHWAKDYIGDLYERSIVNGNGNGTFNPDSNITRAEFVQILYNMSGSTFEGTNSFNDIAAKDWYSQAVAWAVNAGVTQGMSENTFAPNDNITREQMAVMIYRYATLMGADWNITNDSKFADADTIEEYAKYQVRWAKDKGIIEGRPDGTFGAKDFATRAETAAMLSRLAK